jgi:hypothetical protein
MRIRGTHRRRTELAGYWTVLAMSVLGWMTADASASGALRADYRFQNTLASSIGAAPALSALGSDTNSFATETVDGSSQTVLAFQAENGVQLAPTTGVIPNGTYTLAVLFRFAQLTNRAWQRIVDFQNGTSDRGLYVYRGALELYPYARGSIATIKAEEYVLVVLTRDSAGTVTGYVDGTRQFAYDDSSADAAVIDTSNTLRFFRDNESGGPSGESSAGAVARIELYDEALTAKQVADLSHVPPAATGTATADVEGLSFGARRLGTISGSRTVLVTNTGSSSLQIQGVQVTGANLNDFLLSSDGCSYITLPVHESCSIGVRFAPSARGQRSATLRVFSANPLSPLQIAMFGIGRRVSRPVVCTKAERERRTRKRHRGTLCVTKHHM